MRRDFDFIKAARRQRGAFAKIQTRCFILKQIGGHFPVRLLQKVSRDNVGDAFGLFSEHFLFMRDEPISSVLMRVCHLRNRVQPLREDALKDFAQG
jgi:hypothetical protein